MKAIILTASQISIKGVYETGINNYRVHNNELGSLYPRIRWLIIRHYYSEDKHPWEMKHIAGKLREYLPYEYRKDAQNRHVHNYDFLQYVNTCLCDSEKR